MNAITGTSAEHLALQDDYKAALRLWAEARARYSPGSAEVVDATRYVDELEQELAGYDKPVMAA